MSLKITRGRLAAPAKVVIYGVEGIGKTTLASQFPKPIILDTEDGTRHLDVARYQCKDWQALMVATADLIVDRQGFDTVVIDSLDWAEQHCKARVCKDHNKKSLEDWAYGKGFNFLAETFALLLDKCDKLADAGLNVVLVAHSKVVRTSPPDQTEGFDRWELDLDKRNAPRVKEWADAVLFLNYRMRVIEGGDGRHKAIGGKDRVMYAERSAAYDAKNRHGLAPELTLDIESLAPIFLTTPTKPARGKWQARVADATTVEELGSIGDAADQAVSAGEMTPDQREKLDAAIAKRHDELEPVAEEATA